jgi:hypothetical protein
MDEPPVMLATSSALKVPASENWPLPVTVLAAAELASPCGMVSSTTRLVIPPEVDAVADLAALKPEFTAD